MSRAEPLADIVPLPTRRSPARAALVALRPRQWVKNLLLFAGILFAAKLGDPVRWLEAVAAFIAYCAASSAAYLVNDVRDADGDRRHPVKRRRPVAARELAERQALGLASLLAVASLLLVAALGMLSLALLAAFGALQAGYTLRLKHLVLVDVVVIAGLFVVRAAAGAVAVDVRISPWLLVCTGLLALFLALGKRRAELVLVERSVHPWTTGAGRLLDRARRPAPDCRRRRHDRGVRGVHADGPRHLGARRDDPVRRVRPLPLPAAAASPFGGEEPENVLLGDVPILVTVAPGPRRARRS